VSPGRLRTEVGDERCPAGPTCHRKKGGTRLSAGQEEGRKIAPGSLTAGPRSALGWGGQQGRAGGGRPFLFFIFFFFQNSFPKSFLNHF
jgi:hypothetical protein